MKKKKINTMPKNRKMESACDYIHKKIKYILPYIYSAVVLALWNVLDETEEEKTRDIQTLISESQKIWTECVDDEKDIVKWCEEVTGFNIKNEVE